MERSRTAWISAHNKFFQKEELYSEFSVLLRLRYSRFGYALAQVYQCRPLLWRGGADYGWGYRRQGGDPHHTPRVVFLCPRLRWRAGVRRRRIAAPGTTHSRCRSVSLPGERRGAGNAGTGPGSSRGALSARDEGNPGTLAALCGGTAPGNKNPALHDAGQR